MTTSEPVPHRLDLTVLISGAGIAGPALAYWLARYGAAVTVVEHAAGPRPGGQAVDFKGAVHDEVLRRMGIRDEVYRRQTGGVDGVVVDAAGRKIAAVPGDIVSGDVEILRGDLADLLHEHSRDQVEYLFGDTITALAETADGVRVTFAHAAPRTVDLVVGADGIHSRVRGLAFGPEAEFVEPTGYHYALVDLDVTSASGAGEMYSEPGRTAAIESGKASAFFVFSGPGLTYDRNDADQQKAVLAAAYAGGGWRVPELLAALPRAGSVYLDSISRVSVDHWSRGRVALLGDAAHGAPLGGFGTGLAIVGAYVLAGELLAAGGDHRTGFRRYEEVMRRYAGVGEKTRVGAFLAPTTRAGLWLRNQVLRSAWIMRGVLTLTDRLATRVELRDYPTPAAR